MKKEKNKKVYLSNGDEVELLTKFQDENQTKYVIKVPISEPYNENECQTMYEYNIVSQIYENYGDTPLFTKKTKLEKEVEELRKEIKELEKRKNKLKKVYVPKYSIGTPIYCTFWGNEVKELKIIRIVFTEEKDKSFYTYHCNEEYQEFEEIGNGYYLTREEAEKARQEYLKNKEIEHRKEIIENYEKIKKEYENLKKNY